MFVQAGSQSPAQPSSLWKLPGMATDDGCGTGSASEVTLRTCVVESYEKTVTPQLAPTLKPMFAPPGAPPAP